MIFSFREISAFFAALLALGWFLYPDEYTRGLMHRQEGDRSAAIAFFRGYLKEHPFHKGATIALAEAYEGAGRPEEGVGPLLELYRSRRGDLDTGRALLGLYDRAGLVEDGRKFFWELVDDAMKLPAATARKPLEEMLYRSFQRAASSQDDEASLRALAALAQISTESEGYRGEILRLLLARGKLDSAVSILENAAAKAKEPFEIRRTLAQIHRLRKDPKSAARELDALLMARPDDTSVLGDLASLHMEQKDWKEAEKDLRRLVALEPKQTNWHRDLGQCLAQSGRGAEALKLYEELLAQDPSDKERWWTVIYLYADRKDHEKAIAKLESFLKNFPGDAAAFDMIVYQQQQMGDLDAAIATLRRRVAQAPQDAKARKALAQLLFEDERSAEALPHFKALLSLEPDDRENWRNVAYLQASLGDKKAACETLEDYLKRFPDDAKARDQLAETYVALGQRDRAIELLRGFFKPAP
jgi:tetratricopeptide (TPR) repeat protein